MYEWSIAFSNHRLDQKSLKFSHKSQIKTAFFEVFPAALKILIGP